MRNLATHFFQQHALGGEGHVDTSAIEFTGEAIVIAVWIESEQRQPEAILAASSAVAATGIAPCAHEDRHHIELKADGPFSGGLSHGKRSFCRDSAEVRKHARIAICNWQNGLAIDPTEGWVFKP